MGKTYRDRDIGQNKKENFFLSDIAYTIIWYAVDECYF